MIRHAQQNYLSAKIDGIKGYPGSPLIDFSKDPLVAYFFANFWIDYAGGFEAVIKGVRSTNAAVYVLKIEAFPIYRTIQKLISDLEGSGRESTGHVSSRPCIIDPSHAINDLNDQKPKAQKAEYMLQVDLRYSIDDYLLALEQEKGESLFFKIELSKEWVDECADFLLSRGYTLNSMFAKKSD